MFEFWFSLSTCLGVGLLCHIVVLKSVILVQSQSLMFFAAFQPCGSSVPFTQHSFFAALCFLFYFYLFPQPLLPLLYYYRCTLSTILQLLLFFSLKGHIKCCLLPNHKIFTCIFFPFISEQSSNFLISQILLIDSMFRKLVFIHMESIKESVMSENQRPF